MTVFIWADKVDCSQVNIGTRSSRGRINLWFSGHIDGVVEVFGREIARKIDDVRIVVIEVEAILKEDDDGEEDDD